jgi:CubicO group peptidase (beta-lactamase class C family)
MSSEEYGARLPLTVPMRRALLCSSLFAYLSYLLCVCTTSGQAALPSVAGDYGGMLGGFHVRLDIQQDQTGALTGVLYSVDHGTSDPCVQFALSGSQLSFTVPEIVGMYEGKISADGNTITGTWNHQSPLVFTRKPLATATSVSSKLALVDSMVASAFGKNPIGSVTVGVVSGSQLIWTKSYGNSDMEEHLPATKDTVYRIGSITKMFTVLMLEQLADASEVHLSDPVDKYLPEVNTVQGRSTGAPPITLIQLATHTSGLGEEPDDTEHYVHGPVAEWEKTLIAAFPHLHYILEPGTAFSYSNIGYAALGAALERAANQPYLEYVPTHIFGPLGMMRSSLQLNSEILRQLSKGYSVEGGKVNTNTPQREHEGRGYKVPNGAAYTTVGDLARFSSFLLGNGPNSVLKANSLERYLNQVVVPSNAQLAYGYGLGFELMRRGKYVAFGHSGDVDGYQAALYMNREERVGLIVLANATGQGTVNTNDLALRALDLISK